MRSRRTSLVVLALLLAGVATGGVLGLTGAIGGHVASAPSPPPFEGWPFHRKIPATALTAASGGQLSLRSLRGRVVVLAPSLTLCHEICPLTTQAFMLMRRSLAAQGLADGVAFVEATVDPWRDSPARLRAYDRMTGADLIQLTGDASRMRRFWDFFGIGFQRVPAGPSPGVDWWTKRRESFDVEHVDGVFLIDSQGYERRFFPGYADTSGRLEPALRRLLGSEGMASLKHPVDAWSVPEVMAATRRLLGAQRSQRASGCPPGATSSATHMPLAGCPPRSALRR